MTRLQKFLNWLKGLFIHSKEESIKMSEALSDTAVAQQVTTEQAAVVDPAPVVAASLTPASEAKTGVADFEAALKFVEDGVEKLGDAAKDELVALAKKYL
ncbi:hypothetical protein PUG81_05080 [Erwiniaceae bacterium L1_54_6]|nr:hypothetical protein [Erwiniaceae bacterium L1_54_6]